MTPRLELLQRWEAGLEANATPTDEESRFHWLRRVYVRIYSFLISRYASGDWRADSAADASEDDAELATSPMPHVDNTAEVTGLQPKSNEQIRGKLAAIRDANDDRQPPGTTAGLSVKEWVAVASSRDRKTVRRVRAKLAARGFAVRTVWRTTDYCVEIRHGDFEDALRVLRYGDEGASNDWQMSDRLRVREWSHGQVVFFEVLGMIVVGFAGSVFLAMFFSGTLGQASLESVVGLFLLAAAGAFAATMHRIRR